MGRPLKGDSVCNRRGVNCDLVVWEIEHWKNKAGAVDVAQWIECSPSMHKALVSSLSTAQNWV